MVTATRPSEPLPPEVVERICKRKVAFRTRAQARRVARVMRARYGALRTLTLIDYRCDICYQWHLGRHRFTPETRENWEQANSEPTRSRRQGMTRERRRALINHMRR